MAHDPNALRDLLRLTLTPGLGPVLIARLLEAFGSPAAALAASPKLLERIRGIGPAKSASIARAFRDTDALADEELALAAQLGVALIARDDPTYPPLLRQIPDPPPLLYVRGQLRPGDADRYPVAIVGSRDCTAYGLEQSARFAGVLAPAGLTVVSGGARGIDTAAHRGALRAGGRTIAVLGCGLARCYPPENEALFNEVAASGAVVSELPLRTNPESDNFPARNRLISGISLGVIVIEAGRRSGSLITARMAAEDHGREVMAVPGRVDSPSSLGTLELIRDGGAALVTGPGDVIATLETPARHAHGGTHADRYADPAAEPEPLFDTQPADAGTAAAPAPAAAATAVAATPAQAAILGALTEPLTLDELARATGLDPAALRAELTVLEIQRRLHRQGSRIAVRVAGRRDGSPK